MATDVAFAPGRACPPRVAGSIVAQLFLLTLAIVVFYNGAIHGTALGVAAAGIVLSILLRRLRIDRSPVYVRLAVATWYATFRSGVHATINA